jgi:hypothetical protein
MGRERDRTSDDFANYRKKIFGYFFESKKPEIEYYL